MKLHEGSNESSEFVVRWTLKDTGDAAVPGCHCHSKLSRAEPSLLALAKLGRC